MASAPLAHDFSEKASELEAIDLIRQGHLREAVELFARNYIYALRELYQGSTGFELRLEIKDNQIWINGESLQSLLFPPADRIAKNPDYKKLSQELINALLFAEKLLVSGEQLQTLVASPATDKQGNLDPSGRTHWFYLMSDRELCFSFEGSQEEFAAVMAHLQTSLERNASISPEHIREAYLAVLGAERYLGSAWGQRADRELSEMNFAREHSMSSRLSALIMSWLDNQDEPIAAFFDLMRFLSRNDVMGQAGLLENLLNGDLLDRLNFLNPAHENAYSNSAYLSQDITEDLLSLNSTDTTLAYDDLINEIQLAQPIDLEFDSSGKIILEKDDGLYPADEVEAVRFIYPESGADEPSHAAEEDQDSPIRRFYSADSGDDSALAGSSEEERLRLSVVDDYSATDEGSTSGAYDASPDAEFPSGPDSNGSDLSSELAALNLIAERSVDSELLTNGIGAIRELAIEPDSELVQLVRDFLTPTDAEVQDAATEKTFVTESLTAESVSQQTTQLNQENLEDLEFQADSSQTSPIVVSEELQTRLADLSAEEFASVLLAAFGTSESLGATENTSPNQLSDEQSLAFALHSAAPHELLASTQEFLAAPQELLSAELLDAQAISEAEKAARLAAEQILAEQLEAEGSLFQSSSPRLEEPNYQEYDSSSLSLDGNSDRSTIRRSSPKRQLRRAALRKRRVKLLELLRREALRRKMDFSFLMLDRRSLIKNDLYIEGLILGLVELLGLPEAQQARLFADFGVETQEIIRVRELLAAEEKLTESTEEAITPESMPLTAVHAPEEEDTTNELQQVEPEPEQHTDSMLQTSRPASPYKSAPLA